MDNYFNSAQNQWLWLWAPTDDMLQHRALHSSKLTLTSTPQSARNCLAQAQDTNLVLCKMVWFTVLWEHFSACFPLSQQHKTVHIICSYLKLIVSQYYEAGLVVLCLCASQDLLQGWVINNQDGWENYFLPLLGMNIQDCQALNIRSS